MSCACHLRHLGTPVPRNLLVNVTDLQLDLDDACAKLIGQKKWNASGDQMTAPMDNVYVRKIPKI